MEDNKVDITDAPIYSLEQLRSDIFAQYDSEEQTDSEEKRRDKLLKLKVLNHLINIVSTVVDISEEDRCDIMRMKLAEDEALFGYTCFLASNSEFDYSWNYQRKQWDKYIEVLGRISLLFTKMLSCVKMLQVGNYSFVDEKFVFANLFIITFDDSTNSANVKVIWENIEQLFFVQKGYSISAQLHTVLLLSAFCRYDGNDLESFFENLSKLKIQSSKNV